MRLGLGFVLRRLALAVGTLAAVSVLLFAAAEVVPGDAAAASLGSNTSPQQLAALRAELGLDAPLPARYLRWASHAVRGDLGESLVSREPVTARLATPFGDTALLVALSAALTLPLALAVGLVTGLRPGGRVDRLVSGLAVLAVSVPPFIVAVLLVLLFSAWLHWLPAVSLIPLGGGPLAAPEILVLPVLSLVIFSTAWAGRLVRATVVDANAAPNVEAARLAGLPEWTVLRRHLLPATVPACAQAFGWLLGALFGGTAVVEQVFNYPGLSQLLVGAVRSHDTPVLEGVGLLLAAIIVAGLLLADAVALLATPRLRVAGA